MKVTIFNAAHCGNVGDDLIASIMEKYLAKSLAGVEVVAVPQHHREEIPHSDVVVVGGGGIIYDYNVENVINYTEIINEATSLRIPVYLMGIGVQHVFTDKAKNIYKKSLKQAKFISTRSIADSEFLSNELSYPNSRIITSHDLAFLYEDVFNERLKPVTRSSVKPKLVASFADWKLGNENYKKINQRLPKSQESYRKYIKKTLPQLAEDFDITIVCQAKEDIELSTELAASIGVKPLQFNGIDDAHELVEVYKDANIAITGRYHGLIAAIIAGCTVIPVSFSSHKQEKLINESFRSIKDQFYTISMFEKEDVLLSLLQEEFRKTLKKVKPSEYKTCVASARKNKEIVKYISGDIATS